MALEERFPIPEWEINSLKLNVLVLLDSPYELHSSSSSSFSWTIQWLSMDHLSEQPPTQWWSNVKRIDSVLVVDGGVEWIEIN